MVKHLLHSCQSVLFLDGHLPPQSILKPLIQRRPIFAADGALDRLHHMGLFPQCTIGDGDSVQQRANNYIYSSDQNTTDGEKALLRLQQQKLCPCLIFGVSGGEIDHVLGNFQMMMKYSQIAPSIFIDTYHKNGQAGMKIGVPVHQKLTLSLTQGSLVSLIPFGSAIVTTTGLQWPLHHTTISTDSLLTIRNRAIANTIVIEVSKGSVLLIADLASLDLYL